MGPHVTIVLQLKMNKFIRSKGVPSYSAIVIHLFLLLQIKESYTKRPKRKKSSKKPTPWFSNPALIIERPIPPDYFPAYTHPTVFPTTKTPHFPKGIPSIAPTISSDKPSNGPTIYPTVFPTSVPSGKPTIPRSSVI